MSSPQSSLNMAEASVVEPETQGEALPERTPKKMSYEEYLAWADEDTHAEWVDGEVITFMPPICPCRR